MSNLVEEICQMCIEEDFGYCGLRNSKIELKYKHNKNGDLIKCSGFCPDTSKLKIMFKINEVLGGDGK